MIEVCIMVVTPTLVRWGLLDCIEIRNTFWSESAWKLEIDGGKKLQMSRSLIIRPIFKGRAGVYV